MSKVYKFLVDCVGGPYDGTSLTVIDVNREYKGVQFTHDTETVPWEQQFGQYVYVVTDGGEVGKIFSLPATMLPIPIYDTNDGHRAFTLFHYKITGRDIDEVSAVILCTAIYESHEVVTTRKREE